MVELAD
jgi:hypothetical protein